MPHLQISTNAPISDSTAFLRAASRLVADGLAKPEAYVMVQMVPLESTSMCFSQTSEPCAFLALKSIGLPTDLNELIAQLSQCVTDHLQIPNSRIFVICENIARTHWGHHGETLG